MKYTNPYIKSSTPSILRLFIVWCLLLTSSLSNAQIQNSILNTYDSIDSLVTDAVRRDIGILPAPTFNPSFGTGIAIVPFIIFHLPKASPETHPSTIQGLLMINSQGSLITGIKSTTYLSSNKFWIDAYVGYMNVHLQPRDKVIIGDESYSSLYFKGFSSNSSVLYNIGSNFYVGPIINANYLSESAVESDASEVLDYRWYITPGGKFSYDTRKDIYYPRDAWFGEATFQGLINRVDGENPFKKTTLGMSNYRTISETRDLIFANRIYSQIGMGDLPLHEKASPGGSSILRGYTSGSYMDNSILTYQSELRWMFAKRWGAVAFVGAGILFDQVKRIDEGILLPSGGTGLRWRMFKHLTMNTALDAAWGKDGPVVYFSLSESF